MELLLVITSIIFVLFVTLVLVIMRHVLNRMDRLHADMARMATELDRLDIPKRMSPARQKEDGKPELKEHGGSTQSPMWDV